MAASAIYADGMKFTPYWWEEAPRPQEEPERVPADADVAVVGSGYTGLSAALTLAKAGRKVVVLEADVPGWGASSRNGGMVGPAFHQLAGARAQYGLDRAKEILAEGLAAHDYVKEVVEREDIRCHYERVGRFMGAMSPAGYDAMARELDAIRKVVPFDAEMVPKARQREEIGSDRFAGGLVIRQDGGLHPALYHLGLLAAARRAGATVLGRTPVTGIERERQRTVVKTPRGELSAGAAIAATNGYTGTVTPALRRRVIPIRSAMIATEPLAPDLMARLMPRRRMLADTRRLLNYFRPSPDGTRVLFGGRALLHGDVDREGNVERTNAEHLHRMMVETFPELAGTRITHYWHGNVAYTFDKLPHTGEIDGLWYAMGYCGSGVTRSTWLGHKLALKIMGKPEGRSVFDALPFETRPLYTGKPWFLPFMIAKYRLMDRLRP
ncbi:MAG: FAD-binding oxidoreductase [Alphaproteobacteria bacterium]|nr:FAD-binding oxidoreductase [Alphaproteobacteria bacterium]